MKAILIAEEENIFSSIIRFANTYGFDFIHYRSAVKALDNIEEIAPDAIFINAVDFPRHWKVITQHIRWDTSKNDMLILLLVNSDFTSLDADKATKIGVQAIINYENPAAQSNEALRNIFLRYKQIPKTDVPLLPEEKALNFMFTNPLNDAIITGRIEKLTEHYFDFNPDIPSSVGNIEENQILENCSLKMDQRILKLTCKVLCAKNGLRLAFSPRNEKDRATINFFINKK